MLTFLRPQHRQHPRCFLVIPRSTTVVPEAIHAVDFTPHEQMDMTDEQRPCELLPCFIWACLCSPDDRLAVARELLPVLSNLAQVFLKRGDFGNVVKASAANSVLRRLRKSRIRSLRMVRQLTWACEMQTSCPATKQIRTALCALGHVRKLQEVEMWAWAKVQSEASLPQSSCTWGARPEGTGNGERKP